MGVIIFSAFPEGRIGNYCKHWSHERRLCVACVCTSGLFMDEHTAGHMLTTFNFFDSSFPSVISWKLRISYSLQHTPPAFLFDLGGLTVPDWTVRLNASVIIQALYKAGISNSPIGCEVYSVIPDPSTNTLTQISIFIKLELKSQLLFISSMSLTSSLSCIIQCVTHSYAFLSLQNDMSFNRGPY